MLEDNDSDFFGDLVGENNKVVQISPNLNVAELESYQSDSNFEADRDREQQIIRVPLALGRDDMPNTDR